MNKSNTVKFPTIRFLNKPILLLTLIFAVSGAFLILDASSISSVLVYGFDTPYYYFTRQLIFIGLAQAASAVIIKIPTKNYKLISILLIAFFLGALLIAYIKYSLVSTSVNEVTLSLFGGRLQPAEFLKVFLIMYMGAYYGSWANKKNHGKYSFIVPIIPCVIAAGLILLGGDFGSAAIMVALYALVFISVPSKEKIMVILKYIACGGMIVAILLLKFGYLIIPQSVLESDYRLNRFIYTNPCDRYEENSGYQVCNGYIAMDNGGWGGVGIGESVQKYMYLPASHTDFIFPIFVEEFGVFWAVVVIIFYAVLIFLTFRVALRTKSLQNSIICYGIAIYVMLHIFVNLGGVLGVIPLTGVPLPFFSYGGSFCITLICSFAVVQRINIENELEKVIAKQKGE